MKISIITITYNSEKTLEETIKSVMAQNYPDLEYIIVDGGSTDKTLEIAEKYKKYISKMISEKDNGISDAFNKGIAMATGDVVGIINSDDLLAEGALKAIAEEMKEETDVFYGNGYRLYPDGHTRDYLSKDLKIFSYKMPLVHPATFVRRKAYEKYGVFRVEYKYCMDRDVLYRMYKGGACFQRTDKYLAYFREGGVSAQKYWSGTLKEGEVISIDFGMPVWKAKLITVYKKLRFAAIRTIRFFWK